MVGREPELVILREFLELDPGWRALVVTGDAGIGKTTLWEAGIAFARGRGVRVLSTRASGAEARLAFTALIDLLDGVDLGALEGLPAPQLRALEVALLRAEPGGDPPGSAAIALGFLNALRALAAREPLLVAIDDVQWLDAPSADVLAFAVRRLEGDAVPFLLAKRPGRASELERALAAGRLRLLEVGPLSLGAMRSLLSERLRLSLPRHLLRRLVESTLGNPLFALEVGRTLAEHGLPGIGEDLPVPDEVEDLLGTRVTRLPGRVRRLLLAVALSADLRTSQLAAIADETAVEDAVAAGVLLVDGSRVRVSHPLLAAVAKKRSRPRERRELHLELAGVVADEELRARHLALVAEGSDEELAAMLARAAGVASARGARQEAAELAEHALRLTPPESAERAGRFVALAENLGLAGEEQRSSNLLVAEFDSLPQGPLRVRARLLLARESPNAADHEAHLERALTEAEGDPVLRAWVLAEMSLLAWIRVERIPDAEAWALEALPAARRAEPELERLVLVAIASARTLAGRPIDDLCQRSGARSDAVSDILDSLDRRASLRLSWRGEVGEARASLSRLLTLADERGEQMAYGALHLNLCELELRSGEWEAASRLLDEWDESSNTELLTVPPLYERCRALLAAGRGDPNEVERCAAEAIARCEAAGLRWDLLESLRARGIAALLMHEPGRAADSLRAVWAHTQREGVDEPGAFPVVPELVEALVELGQLDEARAVTGCLRELAERQEHPWGLATAKRCDALVRLAAGRYDEEAAAELAQASADYEQLGLRFDRARSLLSLGRSQRRHRKWAAARRALEDAAAAFSEIGSPGWVEEVRSELARVGARRPQPAGELTPAERHVVELAADGLSNKEIARALFVTVKTVEAHLSHAYAKLGVRSRSQLARSLSAPG
jgi:DNA-binding CsgD family transcriptional regulator